MIVEKRPEIAAFIHTWKDKPKEQVVEELASYSLETKGIPDPYHFLVSTNGDLFSPVALCRVKDVVQRTSHLGQLEYQALAAIEQWANNHHEGVIAWISPPYAGVYPTSKIIISEIEQTEGVKKLFNRAIVLDFDESKCMRFAQDLAKFSQNRPLLSSVNEIRAHPIVLNTEGRSWTDILEKLIDDPALWTNIRRGEYKKAKKEALIQARIVHQGLFRTTTKVLEAQMMVFEMLGDKPGSCPVLFNTQKRTAFQVFSENSLVVGGVSKSKDPDFCKNCPICGEVINCIVRNGESCPECGAVKRCG